MPQHDIYGIRQFRRQCTRRMQFDLSTLAKSLRTAEHLVNDRIITATRCCLRFWHVISQTEFPQCAASSMWKPILVAACCV